MKTFWTRLLLLLAIPAISLIVGIFWLMSTGLSARADPTAIETRLARIVQRFAIPNDARNLANPMRATPELLVEARRHFADHCASWHANDGSGSTEMGRKFCPRVPDLRSQETQRLSDGELYYIIENGVRFTGMPAWGSGGANDHDTWHLVLFIRQLPNLTKEDLLDMQDHNPRSPADILEEQRESEFLNETNDKHSPSNPH